MRAASKVFARARVPTPWSPWNIPRSQRPLYLSAADEGGLLVQSGGVVSSWTGRHGGLAFTATGNPAYSATGLAGAYPAVSGDGVGAYLTAAATTGLPTGTATCSILALVDTGVSTGGRIVAYGGTSTGTSRTLYPATSNGLYGAVVQSSGLFAAGYTDATTKPRVLVGVLTATEAIIRIDGQETRSTGTLPSAGTTRVRLFANTSGTPGNFLAGSITEILICTELTARQILNFEDYCVRTYPLAFS